MDYINKRFRRPIGLPDLQLSMPISHAAQNHADYLSKHPDEFGHGETPGRAGFTGYIWYDRCLAAGAVCNGEDFSGDSTFAAAIDGWMDTPYHGVPFFTSCSVGFGFSSLSKVIGAAVADFNFKGCRLSGDSAAAPNSPTGALHVWPAEGTRNVWPLWAGGESPDPLEGTNLRAERVGPVMFVFNTGPVDMTVTVSLAGPNGPVTLFSPKDQSISSTLTLNVRRAISSFPGEAYFFAADRLTPGSSYRLTVTPTDGHPGVTTTFSVLRDSGRPKVALSRASVRLVKETRRYLVRAVATVANVPLPVGDTCIDRDGRHIKLRLAVPGIARYVSAAKNVNVPSTAEFDPAAERSVTTLRTTFSFSYPKRYGRPKILSLEAAEVPLWTGSPGACSTDVMTARARVRK